MRFHDDSHARIIAASKRSGYHQRLFLVPDVRNAHDDNAVMLHNGAHKLAYVSRGEAPKVRKLLDELREKAGFDVVLVMHSQPINLPGSSWANVFQLRAVGVVHERMARKHGLALEKE